MVGRFTRSGRFFFYTQWDTDSQTFSEKIKNTIFDVFHERLDYFGVFTQRPIVSTVRHDSSRWRIMTDCVLSLHFKVSF